MKVLIAYASKNGVAKRCAEMLCDLLPSTAEGELVDLSLTTPSLSNYDAVVLGGSVRFERFQKPLRKFLKENKSALSALPSAVYICCGLSHRYNEYAEICLPRGFSPSLGVHHFGGELKPERVRGFDKFVVRTLRSSIKQADFEDSDSNDLSLPEIIPENVKLVAEAIKKSGRG